MHEEVGEAAREVGEKTVREGAEVSLDVVGEVLVVVFLRNHDQKPSILCRKFT